MLEDKLSTEIYNIQIHVFMHSSSRIYDIMEVAMVLDPK